MSKGDDFRDRARWFRLQAVTARTHSERQQFAKLEAALLKIADSEDRLKRSAVSASFPQPDRASNMRLRAKEAAHS